MQKRKSRSLLKIIGFFLFALSLGLLIYSFVDKYTLQKEEEQLLEVFFTEYENKELEEVIEDEKIIEERYSIVLEIPSISLKKGLYDINSKKNNVDYNLEVLSNSNTPDIINGNLIIASHSGTSSVAYFDNLEEVKNEDEIIVFYDSQKYVYKVSNIYEVDKTGTISLQKKYGETIIALITCSKQDKTKQLVVVANQLVEQES